MKELAKNLVIVESPAKASTIEKYLGKSDYLVKATMGHLRDLPKSQFGIDVDNGFEPKYITVRGKTALANELFKLAGQAKTVYLATDPDREGEAIAWHLAALLKITSENACRIEFNEITKAAVTEAIKHARKIDENMVNAQQTRRILDRVVGYKLSPLLWKKVRRGLSAGRVQSVAVRLICDREREIEAFQVTEYWSIHALLQKQDSPLLFEVDLATVDGKKMDITNAEEAALLQRDLEGAESFRVENIKRRDRQRKPYPPFITCTLVLANSQGIIDADYYNNADNEGHILIALLNGGSQDVVVSAGMRIAQGIFCKYLLTDQDESTGKAERTGGIGSTGTL